MKTWLLVDGNFMSYRALHSTGGLKHEGVATGVAFGFIRDLDALVNLHQASTIVLAFDHPAPGLRSQVLRTYKTTRHEKEKTYTEAEREELRSFFVQMDKLKKHVLPELGYRNIIEVEGYEADDIIALIAEEIPLDENGVIVSADKDLWQCLRGNVSFYNPITCRTVTAASFREQWDIFPPMWANVKALAGCGTDDVDGIDGIGEKTAAAYFSGKLKPPATSKPGKMSKWEKITSNLHVHNANLPLVKLPYPGLRLGPIQVDELTQEKKIRVQQSLGIKERRGASDRAKAKSKQMMEGGFDL